MDWKLGSTSEAGAGAAAAAGAKARATKAVAARLNIGVDTVEQQMVHGMRALVDVMRGGTGKIRRRPAKPRARAEEASS